MKMQFSKKIISDAIVKTVQAGGLKSGTAAEVKSVTQIDKVKIGNGRWVILLKHYKNHLLM